MTRTKVSRSNLLSLRLLFCGIFLERRERNKRTNTMKRYSPLRCDPDKKEAPLWSIVYRSPGPNMTPECYTVWYGHRDGPMIKEEVVDVLIKTYLKEHPESCCDLIVPGFLNS